MKDAFEDFSTTPTLTFDPLPEEKEPEQPIPQEQEKPILDDSILSDEERDMVDQFSKQIDLHNSNAILQYGVGTQKKMADFSEAALENVKTKDLGEVGDMLSQVVTELKDFDASEEPKGFFGFFKKSGDKMQTMKAKYTKAEGTVNKICQALEQHQITLMKDIASLDKMYEINKTYFKELSMYILAGKKKLEEVKKTELIPLVAKAEASNLPEDAQAAKDLQSLCTRFEKKIHDLELTRMISIQTAAQIRMIQSNDTMMVEKIQTTVVNTVPLWKSQMVLSLGIEHASQAAKAQREVTSMTNNLLKKNAEVLKMASIEAAKESERGVVDIETLQYTNTTLISTLDEVMQIQADGRQKRQEAEEELRRMEIELRDKLLQI